jgi:hypothetical protein
MYNYILLLLRLVCTFHFLHMGLFDMCLYQNIMLGNINIFRFVHYWLIVYMYVT